MSTSPSHADSGVSPDSGPFFTSLHHSSSTLPNNLAPGVDDKPLARQKRKRTRHGRRADPYISRRHTDALSSPEDQAILEAAYSRDAKPDKAARLDIVRQVKLGEKEVQIWFQNKRQSLRRRSRPLLPHEVAQYQLARLSNAPTPYAASKPTYPAPSPRSSDESQDFDEEDDADQSSLSIAPVTAPIRSTPLPAAVGSSDLTLPHCPPSTSAPEVNVQQRSGQSTYPSAIVRTSAQAIPPGQVSSIGCLANRRNASIVPATEPFRHAHRIPQPAIQADSARRLKKTSSFVRLYMSSDGNASVVTKDGESPSPPRPPPVTDLPGIHSSYENKLAESSHALPATFNARVGLQRTASGRSRDSRAWEFWCDKDARGELEEKAENDSNGDAASAIGLLRSASGRSILGSIPSKRNSLLSRATSDVKRQKLEDSKRPPLQRSHTSYGRLQGKASGNSQTVLKRKHAGSAKSTYISGNDSDKENWSPDSNRPFSSHPDNQSAFSRPVENNAAGVGADTGAVRDMASDCMPGREDRDPGEDAGLAAFMRQGGKHASTSSDDDFDCVQGLLSLSQGNWR